MNEDRVASRTVYEANAWSKPPGGGADQPKASKGRKGILYAASLALIVVAIGLAGFTMQRIDRQGEAGRKQEADEAFRARVETDVKGLLRDPLSATFQDVFYSPDTAAACGEVNSKNAFGGYTGHEHFAYHDGQAAFLNRDTETYSQLIRPCQRARIISTQRLVHNTIDTVEASSMKDTKKGQSITDSKRELLDVDNQMMAMANEKL
ncbi:hypothetical protein [Sphingomonas sp. CFBP 8760]|uniref:hypothetical protein n=1 Tax=Sphingomonas sp. CFBP 8760 TaxID=2775282 RepID=UPI00177BA555|nr:hypothetical protein [Sphingomonas sp. CFBP 8760]MBD8549016.1 hypothetical protein [Sphingomonas sp. CFBP 8760]